MTDTDLKAIYAYLSALPQTTACNTVQNGCVGFFGDAKGAGEVGTNRYRYANTDVCNTPGLKLTPAPSSSAQGL